MPNPYVSPLVVDVADGAQVLNTLTETIMFPDFTFAANDPRIYQGASFEIIAYGDISNVVTTPGTVRFRIRWGGVAGTVLADTGELAMSVTARTSYRVKLEAHLTWRSIGSAGSAFCMGDVFLNNVPVAADSLPQGVYSMTSAGANVPAVVSSLDTTTSKALSCTVDFSVNTATTQYTNHMRFLKAISS